ncbi:MAG: DUF3095 family protein [Caldimonas sp.]
MSSAETIVAAPPATGFFASLPVLTDPHRTFDSSQYRAAPDDWALVVTDIVDSTIAIASGAHKTVNFVAAMAISALKNLCAPEPIPFLFGGDGAVVMVPPDRAAEARIVLARVRGLAAREFGLSLRVGLATVEALRRHGSDVRVGRYEPSAGNSFGVFLGGGVGLLERAIRGSADPSLMADAAIPDALDDQQPVDLSGLSCRWEALRSKRGRMVTLIIQGASGAGEIYSNVIRLASQDGDARPVKPESLAVRWPPTGFMLEARARRRGGFLLIAALKVLWDSLIARAIFARGRPIGGFDPDRYVEELATNTDFCKHDETLCFVIDCALDRIEPIRAYVEQRRTAEGFHYGMDIADAALMTCLVTSTSDSRHVHFVDGGGGGYTNAAKSLKAAAMPSPA